jgi:hypothetical protein
LPADELHASRVCGAGCIDLAAWFGTDYRLGYDEAAVGRGERADPWTRTLLCRRGVI